MSISDEETMSAQSHTVKFITGGTGAQSQRVRLQPFCDTSESLAVSSDWRNA